MPSTSGGHGGDDRIEVDPDVLIRAGQQLGAIGRQLAAIVDVSTPVFEGGIASGWDPAGLNFGLDISDKTKDLAQSLALAANGGKALGAMLEMSGYNYQNADAQSTIGGSGPPGGVSGQPNETKAASIPTGPNHFIVLPPALLVALLSGHWWPGGDPSMLKLLAAAWENVGRGFAGFDDEMAAIKTAASTQHIPEGGAMAEKLLNYSEGLKATSQNAFTVAEQIKTFAEEVDKTQQAIRRLVHRLSSLDGILDTLGDIFTGEAGELINDIKQLMKDFQNQVKGVVGLIGKLGDAIGDAVTALQKVVRPYLVAAFGEQAGNALANVFDFYTDFQVGVVTGLLNTVSGTVAMLDADTWKGMYETAKSVAEDPSKLDDVLINMGKGFIAYDALTGDHPGRGLGEAGFNVASLFVPGGALSKTGTLAKGLRYGNKLLDEGRLPRLSDVPGFKDKVPSRRGAPGEADHLPGVPEVRPGAVPDSLMGPRAPDAINAPPTPHDLGGPARPPDAPSPHTPDDRGPGGGGGPPPDHPPGRPVGPSDSAPSHPHGPTQSPPNSVHAPSVSEPSAPSHAPAMSDAPAPVTPHAPETPTPTNTHDVGGSRSEPGPSPTDHGAPTPDSSPHGPAAEQHGGTPGHGDAAEHRPPSEHGTRHDGQTHTPTEHQPAHTPAPEQPGTHDRTTNDGGQVREQPHTPGDGDARHGQPAANAPGFIGTPMMGAGHLAGTHSPSASHAPGAAHTPDGSPSTSPKSEGPKQGPQAKAPHPESPKLPGEHTPKASGPAPGKSPSPPVSHTAAPHASGAAGEPRRPESHTPQGHTPPHGPHHGGPEDPHPSRPGDVNNPPDIDNDGVAHSHDSPDDAIPPPLHRDQPYPHTGGILHKYVGEQFPGGPMGHPGVTYLDEVERERLRVTVRNGLVHDSAGALFDTSGGVSAFGASHAGRAIFVMDEHGNLYASTYQEFRKFHHSSFFAGGNVAAAGEIIVKDGKLEFLSDCSGHYQPGHERTRQVLEQLASQGVHVDPTQIFLTPRP